MIRLLFFLCFLGFSTTCLSLALLAQKRSPIKSVVLTSYEQTVQLGFRNVGEPSCHSVMLFNSSWFSDKEILSVTPNCGCLKVTPQKFLLGSRKQANLSLAINEYPTPGSQRFVTIIEWKEVGHQEHHYSTVNFDIDNLDVVKLPNQNLTFDLSRFPQHASVQSIPFQRGESSVAWKKLALQHSSFVNANISWSNQNSGVISVSPILAKCEALSDQTTTDVALKFFSDQDEKNLVAIRHINVDILNRTDIQVFPTTFYFGEIPHTQAANKEISVTVSNKSQTVRCLKVQSDNHIVQASFLNISGTVNISAKITRISSVRFMSGYITAEIQDEKSHSITIPYYAIFD